MIGDLKVPKNVSRPSNLRILIASHNWQKIWQNPGLQERKKRQFWEYAEKPYSTTTNNFLRNHRFYENFAKIYKSAKKTYLGFYPIFSEASWNHLRHWEKGILIWYDVFFHPSLGLRGFFLSISHVTSTGTETKSIQKPHFYTFPIVNPPTTWPLL